MTIPPPIYVAARRILLDALEALSEHRQALILVGAQAVYVHAGHADLEAIAPYTSDADLGIDPELMGDEPAIVDAMTKAGFQLKTKGNDGGTEPGSWVRTVLVDGEPTPMPVDLIVPEAFAPGHGRRDARLPNHGRLATRWAAGLEAALLDNETRTMRSLEPDVDPRTAQIRVAGVAALLIAKAHKVGERLAQSGRDHRIRDKDSGDIIRLMRFGISAAIVASRLAQMRRNPRYTASIDVGLDYLEKHFGTAHGRGVDLAVQALAGGLDEHAIRGLAPAYLRTVREQIRAHTSSSLLGS